MHSIALRKKECLHESQAGTSPHNISNDLADKAALIITAAFQTSLGGRKKCRFLRPGFASHPRPSRDPERKTCAGTASVTAEERSPTHPPVNCQHSKAGAACPGGQVTNGTKRTNGISSWSAGDLIASSTAGTRPLLSLLLNGKVSASILPARRGRRTTLCESPAAAQGRRLADRHAHKPNASHQL